MVNETSNKAIESVRTLLEGFHQKYNTDEDLEKYMSVYAEDVHWFDHGFRVCRIGRTAVKGLRTAFLHCNQPFDKKIKSIEATTSGSITAELIWLGRTTNDIVRPNGQIAVKATGKEFECHVCMLFKVNDQGQINRIDEYYNKQWDDGIAEAQYTVMKGDSLKKD